MRSRQLCPFFDQCGVRIGEQSGERRQRRPRCDRSILGRTIRQAKRVRLRSPSCTSLDAGARRICQQRVRGRGVATKSIGANRRRRGQGAKTFLGGWYAAQAAHLTVRSRYSLGEWRKALIGRAEMPSHSMTTVVGTPAPAAISRHNWRLLANDGRTGKP